MRTPRTAALAVLTGCAVMCGAVIAMTAPLRHRQDELNNSQEGNSR